MNKKRLITQAALLLAFVMILAVGSVAWAGYHYVGERVYNITRDAYATIEAIAVDGSYVIQFETGPLAGQTGRGWRDPELASLSGCSRDLCAGNPVFNVSNDDYAQIVAIQYDGNYVLYFSTGPFAGQTGHGWSRDALATLQGCYGDICVGQAVYNLPRQAGCTVIGIQVQGLFALRFDTGPLAGQTGHGWARSDLAVQGPMPPPPGPPGPPTPPPGHYTCTLTVNGSQYVGYGNDQGQATAEARDQCLRYDTSYNCNAGPVSCHR